MGSSFTPPWISELVARNHKIVRSMWHSVDPCYVNLDGSNDFETEGSSSNNTKQVVEPKSTSINMTGGTSTMKNARTMADVVLEQQNRITKCSRPSAENPCPTREGGGFMNDVDSKHYMKTGDEPESILEYGPGIVRKLRSRYQSLALRQSTARPSLRRSASLENVLDVDASGDGIKCESPSPTPYDQNGTTNDKKLDSNDVNSSNMNGLGMTKSKSTSAVVEHVVIGQIYEKKHLGSRGRAAVSDRRDRMRRARSVDALQRTKPEEEILEKFKAVVLPKEEIVIIEVSKPLGNITGLPLLNNSSYYLATSADKVYPTHLCISTERSNIGLTESGPRPRSFVSPEHELPPHDIVRDTARIFEKNQENNKRIGQALRLHKSSSVDSYSSSVAQSPTTPLSPLPEMSSKSVTENISPIAAFKTTNTKSAVVVVKQVGVIKPTVNSTSSPIVMDEKATKPDDPRPLALSPILTSPSQHPYKTFLKHQQQKPPLSPKPLFTSSPKPQASVFGIAPSNEIPNDYLRHSIVKDGNEVNDTTRLHKSPINSNGNKQIMSMKASFENDNLKQNLTNCESPSEVRRQLKHVPNSFTIGPSQFEQTKQSSSFEQKSSQQVNGSIAAPSPVESKSAFPSKKVTVKVTETPKLATISATTNNAKPLAKTTSISSKSNSSPVIPAATIPSTCLKLDEDSSSQLRTHQKQKSSNQGANSTIVFNFTSRLSVPDYIEDDGLHQGKFVLAGTVMDESVDDIDSGCGPVELKLINFVGANVIINGKSSIQKRPKSSKLNISFNEDAITTYEYPSESSLLAEEDANEKDMLGHKGPSLVNNSGSVLGNYTPKLGNNDYQLGTFDVTSPKKAEVRNKDSEKELIEDYLKPNSEDTTWSNEITADILF